jgi:hypothetical protein
MKVYVLSLCIDIDGTPGDVVAEEWGSTSKEEIEKKKDKEMQDLLDYFSIVPEEGQSVDDAIEEWEEEGEDMDYCGYSICRFPGLDINEIEFTKEVKKF